MDSWHGLPLIRNYIEQYEGLKLISELAFGSLQITYRNEWYLLHDNGGEITVQKINQQSHFAEFPTVDTHGSLNSETLMYRLIQTLKGEEIDYQHRVADFHALYNKPVLVVTVDDTECESVNWWAA